MRDYSPKGEWDETWARPYCHTRALIRAALLLFWGLLIKALQKKRLAAKQASVSYKEMTTMTTGDKGKLFILFVSLFTLSLSTQQDCVLPVFIPVFFR